MESVRVIKVAYKNQLWSKTKSKYSVSTSLHACGTEAKFNEDDRHLCRKGNQDVFSYGEILHN